MKLNHFLAGFLIIALATVPASAAPTKSSDVAQVGTAATIPFLPPLDVPLRYRWEKTVEKDGKTRMSWSTSDFRFEELGEGYRLTVTPISGGSNTTDPDLLAMEKKLAELLDIPFVLRLDASGQIEALENSSQYWSAIIRVVREEFERMGAKSEPKVRQALSAFIDMYEKLPEATRLALLTEPVQPVLEFGDTETQIGKPIATVVESESPFGGTLKRDVVVSLTKIADQSAFLTIRSSVQPEELAELTANFIKKLAMTSPEEQARMKQGFASLEKFHHETVSEYRVALEDGILETFRSTETIEAVADGKSDSRITSRSITLMD